MRGQQETLDSIKNANRRANMVVFAIILLFLLALFLTHWYFFTTEINKTKSKDEPIYFSILFIDDDKAYGAFIGVVSSLNNRLGFIGIPSNMGLWMEHGQLPVSLTDHYRTGKSRDAFLAIENTFQKKLTYKIELNNQGIANIIDLLGGVRMYIENPINYRNEEKEYYLELDTGEHFFTSDKALAYLNYITMDEYKERQTLYRLEDIFINLLVRFIQEPILKDIITSKSLLREIKKNIISNFKPPDLKAIANIISQAKEDSFIIESMDGSINKFGILEPILEGRVAVKQLDELTLYIGLKTEKSKVSNEDVNLIVLNATSISMLADSINIRMRYRGFLAGEYGNFITNTANSIILIRGGQIEKAFLVAKEGKVNRVYAKTDRSVLNDAVIILGDDYYEIR